MAVQPVGCPLYEHPTLGCLTRRPYSTCCRFTITEEFHGAPTGSPPEFCPSSGNIAAKVLSAQGIQRNLLANPQFLGGPVTHQTSSRYAASSSFWIRILDLAVKLTALSTGILHTYNKSSADSPTFNSRAALMDR